MSDHEEIVKEARETASAWRGLQGSASTNAADLVDGLVDTIEQQHQEIERLREIRRIIDLADASHSDEMGLSTAETLAAVRQALGEPS